MVFDQRNHRPASSFCPGAMRVVQLPRLNVLGRVLKAALHVADWGFGKHPALFREGRLKWTQMASVTPVTPPFTPFTPVSHQRSSLSFWVVRIKSDSEHPTSSRWVCGRPFTAMLQCIFYMCTGSHIILAKVGLCEIIESLRRASKVNAPPLTPLKLKLKGGKKTIIKKIVIFQCVFTAHAHSVARVSHSSHTVNHQDTPGHAQGVCLSGDLILIGASIPAWWLLPLLCLPTTPPPPHKPPNSSASSFVL